MHLLHDGHESKLFARLAASLEYTALLDGSSPAVLYIRACRRAGIAPHDPLFIKRIKGFA